MILVIGATGTNGRVLIERLLAANQPVRALVRDRLKATGLGQKQLELVEGDLDNPASLDAALAGVERAFFVAAVDQRFPCWFHNFLAAARRAGTSHIVKFSGMGAGADSPSELMRQHGETDQALADSGAHFTILRPNSFYQNMLWSAASIRSQGAFYLPTGNARQSLVDVRDIASVAAAVLTSDGPEGQIYEITGPESLSYQEVADALTTVLGKPVRYIDVPPEAALDSMLKSGMPEWNARAISDLYATFAAGSAARTTDTVEQITGIRPFSFEHFARDHASAFT